MLSKRFYFRGNTTRLLQPNTPEKRSKPATAILTKNVKKISYLTILWQKSIDKFKHFVNFCFRGFKIGGFAVLIL